MHSMECYWAPNNKENQKNWKMLCWDNTGPEQLMLHVISQADHSFNVVYSGCRRDEEGHVRKVDGILGMRNEHMRSA